MAHWTNKQWGAVIGALVVIAIALVGVGITALAVLAGIAGYFVGKFLDGELDLQEIQARAQERYWGLTQSPAGPVDRSPYTAGQTPNTAAGTSPPPDDPGGTRVR